MTMGELGVCQLTSSVQQWALRVLWGLKHPACLMTPPPLPQPHQPLNRSLWSLSIEIQEGGVCFTFNKLGTTDEGGEHGRLTQVAIRKEGDKEGSEVLRKRKSKHRRHTTIYSLNLYRYLFSQYFFYGIHVKKINAPMSFRHKDNMSSNWCPFFLFLILLTSSVSCSTQIQWRTSSDRIS